MTGNGFDITTGGGAALSDIGAGLRRAAGDMGAVWIPAHGFGPLCGFLGDELNSALSAVRADLADRAGVIEQTGHDIVTSERLLLTADEQVARSYTDEMRR